MSSLPLKSLTLYKHGVGFFHREGPLPHQTIKLLYDRSAMNDILKSLTVTTGGEGQILGIDFETPRQTGEILAANTIRLDDGRALRDLFLSIRGRAVICHTTHHEEISGLVLGIDEPAGDQPLGHTVISLFDELTGVVRRCLLGDLSGVSLLDKTAKEDLAYFLQHMGRESQYGTITLRFSEDANQAAVSYVAPAPTWRISYRLIGDKPDENGQGEALFQGWAIFDNILEEDLNEISLSLVAGMPISFTYGLYHPHVPERPHFEDEQRTINQEITFDGGVRAEAMLDSMAMAEAPASASPRPQARRPAPSPKMARERAKSSVQIDTKGSELGELFEYQIQTPVSVGRGQSAMVPIFQTDLNFEKRLIFNEQKYKKHPVAVYEAANQSGTPLERGPVTVVEGGDYLGDAIINFTPAEAKIVVPFAVELGVAISRSSSRSIERRGISLRDAFLIYEDWEIITTSYRLRNKLGEAVKITIEHPRETHYNLVTTSSLQEETSKYWRFEAAAGIKTIEKFEVVERRLISRRQALSNLSWREAQTAFQDSLLDERSRQRVKALLDILEPLEKREEELAENTAQRSEIFEKQKQIQANLGSLGKEGKEGALRLRYIESLEQSEDQLRDLALQAKSLNERIGTLKNLLATKLKSWAEKS